MLSDAIFLWGFGLCSRDCFAPALCHLLMKVASFVDVTFGGRLRMIQTLLSSALQSWDSSGIYLKFLLELVSCFMFMSGRFYIYNFSEIFLVYVQSKDIKNWLPMRQCQKMKCFVQDCCHSITSRILDVSWPYSTSSEILLLCWEFICFIPKLVL